MEFGYERENEKRKEIIEQMSLSAPLLHFSEEDRRKISEIITSTSIRMTAPEKELLRFNYLTLNPSGQGGGKSTKAGNIRLNIRELVEAVATGAFATVSSYQVPWLAPFAFILLWQSFLRAAEVELTENDAAIIYSMWVYRVRKNNEISKEGLLEKVNTHLKKYSRNQINQTDLNYSLSKLVSIGSIQQSKHNLGCWRLCEWVQPIYR